MHLRVSPTTCLLVLSAGKRTLCDGSLHRELEIRRINDGEPFSGLHGIHLARPVVAELPIWSADPVHNDDFAGIKGLLQRLINPRRSPITTAWVRSRALNFCMICLTWTLTVSSVIKSDVPMSRFR